MPLVERAKVAPANGWGVGICSQLYDVPEFSLERILTTFDPEWWHDWSYLYPGGVPAVYQSSYYSDNPKDVNRRAASWPMVLWGNEPENEFDGESPAVTAVTVRAFKDANPHVKVYGFGNVARIADYLAAYTDAGGPTLDGYHFHAYTGSATDWPLIWDDFRSIAGDKPIVLTEFGGWSMQTPEAEHMRIMDAVRSTLDTDSQLQAAAWFCTRPYQASWWGNSLLDYLGHITPLGKHWLSLK